MIKHGHFVTGLFVAAGLLTVLFAPGCQDDSTFDKKSTNASKGMKLTSSAFVDGAAIPQKHAAKDEGQNVSPPLAWTGVPAAAKELAIIVDDQDSPAGSFVHWVIYKIPTTATELPENLPAEGQLKTPPGAMQGVNSYGDAGYGGPMPPAGKVHRYSFSLFALDAPLNVAPGLEARELREKIFNHVVAEARIVGTYKR